MQIESGDVKELQIEIEGKNTP